MNKQGRKDNVDNGFHDFTDPRKGLEELFEKMKQWHETGYEGDMENLFSALSVTLMHLGIDRHVYDIVVPYSAALYAMGEDKLARAMARVTMRIGRTNLAVAYAVHSEMIPWDSISEVPPQQRACMAKAIVCVLQGMGATVDHDGEVITITGWDCNDPDHDHPIHNKADGPVTMNIDQAVSEFRRELDRELGDSTNPAAKWLSPRKDDE